MLVLSRKRDESLLLINDEGVVIAELVVCDIRGDKVRIGTNAPDALLVFRRELLPPEVVVGGKVPSTFLVPKDRKESA